MLPLPDGFVIGSKRYEFRSRDYIFQLINKILVASNENLLWYRPA